MVQTPIGKMSFEEYQSVNVFLEEGERERELSHLTLPLNIYNRKKENVVWRDSLF